MKRTTPIRDLRLLLVVGAGVVCWGAAGAQQRHSGGGQPSYHQSAPQSHQAPTYHQPAPQYHQPAPQYRQPTPQYRQPEPQYRQAEPGYRQPMPGERYAGQQYAGQQYAGQQQAPAPVERRTPGQPGNQEQRSQLNAIQRRNPQPGETGKGEHLQAWMNQHRNLTPEQQQQALDREPGFKQLPQATQERMHNHLAQLNAMNPQQRQRTQNHIEWMEHLSVEQRGEVRGSLQQLGSLPEDQRRQVAQSFRNLRALPPDQRAAALNSPQYQYMNPAQRSALNNLMRVEPLIPPSEQQQPR